MSTIVIEQAEVRLTIEQLLKAIRQLTPDEREQVQRELHPRAWEERFDNLLERIRASVERDPISDEEITAEVEAVRAAHYAKRGY